jgi:hypothetical protein
MPAAAVTQSSVLHHFTAQAVAAMAAAGTALQPCGIPWTVQAGAQPAAARFGLAVQVWASLLADCIDDAHFLLSFVL